MASPWGDTSILADKHAADRTLFARRVSDATGIDFYTVLGWEHAEGGPFDNPLGVMSGGNLGRYGTTNAAAAATIKRLQDPIYAPLLRFAKLKEGSKSQFDRAVEVREEAGAISQSPWGPWGTQGSKDDPRRKTYFENILAGVDTTVKPPSGPALKQSGNVGGILGHIPGVEQGNDVIQATSAGVGSLTDLLQWPFQNWQRLLELSGGAILLILGLVMLGRNVVGSAAFKAGKAAAA